MQKDCLTGKSKTKRLFATIIHRNTEELSCLPCGSLIVALATRPPVNAPHTEY